MQPKCHYIMNEYQSPLCSAIKTIKIMKLIKQKHITKSYGVIYSTQNAYIQHKISNILKGKIHFMK